MTLFIGILLSILSGYFLVNCITPRFSLAEKIGLSFPVGMAVETILMLLIDLCGIPFSTASLLGSQFVFAAVCIGLSVKLYKKDNWLSVQESLKCGIRDINLVWFLFIIVVVYMEYMNFSKCLYFPPFDRDSLTSFETIGYVAAQEQTYKNLSLFKADFMSTIHNAGSTITYAPFVQLSYAYVYTLGAETSKIIPGLMYLFFLIALYGSAQRVTTKTGAAMLTFFVLITPEMTAFSSLSITNVMHAVYASLAIIYLSIYFKQKQSKDLYLSGLLLGLNMWCRTEGLVFIGAALLIYGIYAIVKKEYKMLAVYAALAVVPALFWSIFMKINGFYAESIAIIHLFWDAAKIATIKTYMMNLFTTPTYYGWSFMAFIIMLLANGWFIYKKKDNPVLPLAIVLAVLAYCAVLYQIDYKWDTITNVLSYSAKRFLFCFVPLVWYYTFSNYIATSLLEKLDKFLRFPTR